MGERLKALGLGLMLYAWFGAQECRARNKLCIASFPQMRLSFWQAPLCVADCLPWKVRFSATMKPDKFQGARDLARRVP